MVLVASAGHPDPLPIVFSVDCCYLDIVELITGLVVLIIFCHRMELVPVVLSYLVMVQ